MRYVACFLLFAGIAAPLGAASSAPSTSVPSTSVPSAEPDVTVILNFKGASSPVTIAEMKKESAQILAASGLRIGWRFLSEAFGQSFPDLVVMTFNGSCMYQAEPRSYDEPAPFAITNITNGVVQPFGEVDCDHVAGSAGSAMTRWDRGQADRLVGRALGRVVAHELVHMLTHSEQHGREGVAKPSLSGRQLVDASLALAREDADRLRFELRSR